MENKIITEKEAIASMFVKVHNELMSMEITNRILLRADMKNDLSNEEKLFMGKNQEKIKRSKDTLKHLAEFMKDANDEKDLAKVIEKYYTA